ncbi:MAG: hypothetical protein AAGA54_35050, partial [Myxococcota bacterium]
FVEDPERTTDAHPRLTASAHAATALTVGTLVAAIVVGRPWTLSGRPQTERVTVPQTRFSVLAPPAEVVAEESPEGVIAVGVGDILTDPYFVGVEVRPWLEQVEGAIRSDEIEAWLSIEPAVPEEATRIERTESADADPPSYEEVYRYPNGAHLYSRAYMFEDVEVVVTAFVFDGASEAITASARGAIGSLQATRRTPDAAPE